MVYTDGSHLIADTLQELYAYATKIGLNHEWIDFMGRNVHPHFDIFGHVKKRVLADETVKKVSKKELVKILKLSYRLPETAQEKEEWENFHNKKLQDLEHPSEDDFKKMIDNIFKKSGLK